VSGLVVAHDQRAEVAEPGHTETIGLSLLDFGARRLGGFAEDELLVAVPFHRMIDILHALDQGVGRAREEKPESIERQIDELGKIEPV